MQRKLRFNLPVGIFYTQGLSLSRIHVLSGISAWLRTASRPIPGLTFSMHKKANAIFFDAKPAFKTAWIIRVRLDG